MKRLFGKRKTCGATDGLGLDEGPYGRCNLPAGHHKPGGWHQEWPMPTRTTLIERRNAAVEQIPRNCICGWAWKKGQWTRTVAADSCPWHLSRRPKP